MNQELCGPGRVVIVRRMADLTAAVTALHALAGDDVEVTSDQNTTRIVIRYLDTAPAQSLSQEKASYEFAVQFLPEVGEYKLSSTQRGSESGLTGGGLSVQKNSGPSKSFSFTAQAGPGGTVVSSFDSRPWETSIRSRVEEAGWTRKKGLLGRLFGR